MATALADARGRAVPGKVVPEDVTLTWSKTGGNLVNCRGYVRNDDVEGDKSLSECKASQIAANGTATPWIPVAAADDNGADFSTYAVAADSDRRFFHVAERTSGSAVGACIDSHTGYARGPGGAREELSFLPTCELWAPRVFRAPRKGGEIFLLSGTDTEKFGIAYEHYQGEGSATNPWQLPPAQRIFVQGTGPSPTVTKLTGSYPVDAIAATRDTLAIVGRPERDAKLEEARLTATVIPLPGGGTSTAVTLVVAAGKSDFGRPVAAATDAGFLVVWSERPRGTKPYHLAGARISRGSGATMWTVETLGPLTTGPSAFAPGLASAGGRTALTYTIEQAGSSEVRFACGTGDLKSLATNATAGIGDGALRRQDSEVALSDDGASGLLAWHEFSKKTQEVRITPFTCAAR